MRETTGSKSFRVITIVLLTLFTVVPLYVMITSSLKNLGGPGTIAEVATSSAHQGFAPFLGFLAMVSVGLGVLNLLPSGVIGSMLKHVDFLASDVPGVPVTIYLAGARVEGSYAFGPTTGAALNVTLVSYGDTCCIGCTIDTDAVPDPDLLVQCLREGFDEVLHLAGDHRPCVSPLEESERVPPDPVAGDGRDDAGGDGAETEEVPPLRALS